MTRHQTRQERLEEMLRQGYRPVDGWSKARILGEEAQQKLAEHYINSGVSPEVAGEYSNRMPCEELAGLRSPFLWYNKVNPNLQETMTEFDTLVREGFDPTAAAILLTDGSFRNAHQNSIWYPQLNRAKTKGRKMAEDYMEAVGRGENPVEIALRLVREAEESYKS